MNWNADGSRPIGGRVDWNSVSDLRDFVRWIDGMLARILVVTDGKN